MGVSDVPDGHRIIPFYTREVKNSEQLANQAPLDDKGVTMDKEAAVSKGSPRLPAYPPANDDSISQQDQLRQLAALYPLQAGSLYTTFTDLMLCGCNEELCPATQLAHAKS